MFAKPMAKDKFVRLLGQRIAGAATRPGKHSASAGICAACSPGRNRSNLRLSASSWPDFSGRHASFIPVF